MVGLVQARLKPLVPVLIVALVQACGGGGDGGTNPQPSTAIAKATGDGQSGIVGQALTFPIEVTVTEDGTPAAGATVTWSTSAAGGSVDPTSAATDAGGIASTSWILGTTSGSQTAQASLSGASGSPVTFTATAAPGPAAALSDGGGNNQSAVINTALAARVQAKVADQFGNGVSGVTVGWAATNATVSAAEVPSDAAGISGVTVTAGGTPGPIVIMATANALAGSPFTFAATATAEPPPTSNISVVNNQFSPAAITVSPGTRVTWTWASNAVQHNVAPAATEPTRSGNLASAPNTYQYTFNNPGTYVYYCELHGSPTAGMRGTVTVQ